MRNVFGVALNVLRSRTSDWPPRSLGLILLSASTLMISACGQGGSGGNSGTGTAATEVAPDKPIMIDRPEVSDVIPIEDLTVIPTEAVRPFVIDGPYADVLKACAFPEQSNYCTLATLPYIGQATEAPTVEDILNRTLVTHDWMGIRFGEVLRALPVDVLYLFQPVTSVVIGSEVRPSSFLAANGRMLLDASLLWLSVEEKKTISRDEDYRSSFGTDLQFIHFWRFMKGDEFAVPYSSLLNYSVRELDDILLLAASHLYHELAHANDFMNPSLFETLSTDLTPLQAVDINWHKSVSVRLYSDESMTSQASELYGLARVLFRGDTPEDHQKSMQADFVGSVMSNEGKVRLYGYSTQQEDVATLFEQAMLKLHFNTDLHIGFTNKPSTHPEAACEEYIVAWGSRNRLAAPLVLARSKWVTEQLLGPSEKFDDFFGNNAGDDIPLRMGDNWCDSKLSTPALTGNNRQSQGKTSIKDVFREQLRPK